MSLLERILDCKLIFDDVDTGCLKSTYWAEGFNVRLSFPS